MDSMVDELHTVRDWLRWAMSRFNEAGLYFGHGCDNAYDEAAWLILHTLHLPLDRLEPFLDARLTHSERLALLNILQQRITRRLPAAYLTGEAWLGEFRFFVDERVIVPRSYFAEMLVEGLSPWVQQPSSINSALDLCTGSGCLAILMAHTFPGALIDGVDLSADALAVAARNVSEYGLQSHLTLIESDLFEKLTGRRYDLILSNPPYVTDQSMAELPPEYRHEPQLALAAGSDGLDIVRRILSSAKNHLTKDGLLMVEVGHNADLVATAYPDVPFTWVDATGGEARIFLLTREQLETHC